MGVISTKMNALFNFSSVFGNDMVLQRDVKSAVYGSALPNDVITVSISGSSQIYRTIASRHGFWKVLIDSHNAGGSYTITASSKQHSNTIQLVRIMFGDVWYCSGQSNMELSMHFTLSHNHTYKAIRNNSYSNIHLLHFDHNPQLKPTYVTNGSIISPWKTAATALADGSLDKFAATCWYFGESLTDRMMSETEAHGGEIVPIGLIESAFGGTMIESWIDAPKQFECSNITCTANQTMHFTKETEAACMAAASSANTTNNNPDILPRYTFDYRNLDPHISAKGAGANGQLYNGMVLPFVNMSLKGWLWYQGENNLGKHAGNVLDKAGYACMLPLLVRNWREIWSAEVGTTDPVAPFGIVLLADSTDEGWGANVPQMHWAQTANTGFAPNKFLSGTFLATAHDLADPWDDGCKSPPYCCEDTGKPVDPSCGPHRGFLVQTGKFPGVTEPVTPTMGLTIHPRVKKLVGKRLAQAAWSLVYGHSEVAWTGPVLSGCTVAKLTDGTRILRVRFNKTLLKDDVIKVAKYNETEHASVMWVLVDKETPADADHNYLYQNRQPWWGDNSDWKNVNIALDATDNTLVVILPSKGNITAIQYGHLSPKGSPQNGHDKICCGNRNFALDPCAPNSCPISSARYDLPAMPFHAQIINGKCKCFLPQVCDEQ